MLCPKSAALVLGASVLFLLGAACGDASSGKDPEQRGQSGGAGEGGEGGEGAKGSEGGSGGRDSASSGGSSGGLGGVGPSDPGGDALGTLLPGPEETLATAASFDFTPVHVPGEDELSGTLVRTRVRVKFREDATVGGVNDFLDDHGARIQSMVAGFSDMSLRLPDPGSRQELMDLLEEMRDSSVITWAHASYLATDDALPENHRSLTPAGLQQINHLISHRFPAAYNVQTLAQDAPDLFVLDKFGQGPPGEAFGLRVATPERFRGSLGDMGSRHGYGVLATISAPHTGGDDGDGRVTGAFPGQLSVDVYDLFAPPYDRPFGDGVDALTIYLRDHEGRVIVNSSVGDGAVGDPALTRAALLERGRDLADEWMTRIWAIPGLSDRYLHVSSAGNDGVDASLNNVFCGAALFPGLSLGNVTNTLVVESGIAADDPDASFPLICLDETSNTGGDIVAAGNAVWTFSSSRGDGVWQSGTSFSAPIAAGLAAYLWSIRPDLKATNVVNLIRRSARDIDFDPTGVEECSASPPLTRQLDAYTATLALDTPADPRVRHSLLDANGDGMLDGEDLSILVRELDERAGALDYSEYDLNGDGYTGGSERAAFDLDLTDEQVHLVDTGAATLELDESGLSDQDVLCYYAFSEWFDDAPATRDSLLRTRCSCGPPFVVEGNLYVSTLEELAALRGVSEVRGTLNVGFMPATNLTDLSCLQAVSGKLTIQGANALTDLRGLEGLREVGALTIANNSLLASLNGLDGLVEVAAAPGSTELAELLLKHNPALQSLDGLGSLTRIAGPLRIEDNAMLSSTTGLAALTEVESLVAVLTATGTPQLQVLELPVLASIESRMTLQIEHPSFRIRLPSVREIALTGEGEVHLDGLDSAVLELPFLEKIGDIEIGQSRGVDFVVDGVVADEILVSGSTGGVFDLSGFEEVLWDFVVSQSAAPTTVLFGPALVGYMELSDNAGLSLAGFDDGIEVLQSLYITNNTGFDDQSASDFADSLSVGEGRVVFGNSL